MKEKIKKHEERMVFSIRIDLNRAYYQQINEYEKKSLRGMAREGKYFMELEPMGVYYFGDNERAYQYKDIVSEIDRIADCFKSKCNEKNGSWMEVTETKLLGIREGSIKVDLSLLTTLFEVAGGIKNIYDCVEIVRNMLSSHFEEELAHRFGGRYFRADTTVLAPTGNGSNNVFASEKVKYKRDAFFYYLLVSNIALLTVVGILVYKAVSLMYW